MATNQGLGSILNADIRNTFSGDAMRSETQLYEIKIKGHVNLDWSASFETVTVQHTENGQTVLNGTLPDQTALHGVLMRIRDFGLTLLEVKRIENPPQPQ
jgi:hypothetical protein